MYSYISACVFLSISFKLNKMQYINKGSASAGQLKTVASKVQRLSVTDSNYCTPFLHSVLTFQVLSSFNYKLYTFLSYAKYSQIHYCVFTERSKFINIFPYITQTQSEGKHKQHQVRDAVAGLWTLCLCVTGQSEKQNYFH